MKEISCFIANCLRYNSISVIMAGKAMRATIKWRTKNKHDRNHEPYRTNGSEMPGWSGSR